MRKAHLYQLENKLSPKWTGPFRVAEALGNGAYRLDTLEGGAIPRTWTVLFQLNCSIVHNSQGTFFSLIRVF